MARPQRNTVDYFPFICQEGKKMFYIEQTYGNDGFATFVKLLRELALSENHYLNLSEPTTLMFLSAKCRVSKEVLEAIINDLVNLGKFDKMLWTENKIIWCADFIDSISDAYNKRNNKCVTYEGLLALLISLGIRKPPKGKIEVHVKPQSKVEYSREDETKEENNKNDLIFNKLLSSEMWVEQTAMQSKAKFSPKEVKTYLKKYNDMINVQFEIKNNKTEYCTHFINWLNKQERNQNKKQQPLL